MPTVLVTGAAGYIGSGLVRSLAAEGWEVRALTREQAPHLGIEHMVADLARDDEAARAACEGVDAVVHLAGDNEVVAARQPAQSRSAGRCWPPSGWWRPSPTPPSSGSSTCPPCTSTGSG